MKSCYDLILKRYKPIFLHYSPTHDDASPYQVWLPNVPMLQKISSGKNIHHNLNLHCDLDLEHSFPIFSHNTPAHDVSELVDVLSPVNHQASYQSWWLWWCTIKVSLVEKGSALQNIWEEQSYFDYLNPQCPWPWNQHSNLSISHVLQWWSITPSLITWGSVIQEISKRIFTNILIFHCDLDLENNNTIFSQDTTPYNEVPYNQVWLQKDKLFRRDIRNYSNLLIK